MSKSVKFILFYTFASIAVAPLQGHGLPAVLSLILGPAAHLGMMIMNLLGVEDMNERLIVTSENQIAAAGYLIGWIIGAGLSYLSAGNSKARVVLVGFWIVTGLINFSQAAVASV